MIVYHGSYCVVKTPSITFSRDSLDFGKGFYVTSIKTEAINWTERFKKRGKKAYLNSRINKPMSNIYEIWHYNSGIADNKIYNTMELYQDNLIEKDEALKRLKYYKPNEQICITNQNVIDKYLKFRYEEEV